MSVEGQEAKGDDERKSSISLDKSWLPKRREPVIPDFVGPRAFGRLLLLKPIARGGMGEVYLAAMGDIEGAERPCVVKLIRKEHRSDASFLARFLDEARIQAQMQHPGVAQVLEAALDPDGQPYVVVEHIQGRDLAEIRQRAAQLKLSITWWDAVAIAASIADALAHVHERTDADGRPLEVVHRDLSPQNIMVSYVGDTKLIDFGTARGENRRCQTINGIVFAKPGYVAPEVAANNPGGAPADLYALGVVLWELCAGRRFLQGDSREHLAAVAKGERTPPALSLWLAVPRELDTIVARLTATRIADRFESAREAAEQLVRLLQQAPSLANGERSVRARIAHLMLRLYPAEPARSRAEFAELVTTARATGGARPEWTGAPGKVDVKELLFPGTRYRVVRDVAQGPMSVVHEAQHVDLGRKVALKVLDRQRCQSPEAAARFRHEARVVAQLKHPNLVQIHDFGVSADGRPYYAMEYLEGETLAERLARQGRLPWQEAVGLCVQACLALETAHALGVIHRDIKPANLFVTGEGVVKVLDFGITQSEIEPRPSDSESLSLIGTPEYMAPEQIGQRTVDARADIYALGSVLYELITGYLPHVGANTVTLLDNKVHDRVKPPSQRVRKLALPRYLDRVVLTALATQLEDRYDNVTGMRQDLVWILGSQERGRENRRRALGATLALASAGLVVGVMTFDDLSARLGRGPQGSVVAEAMRSEKSPASAAAEPAVLAARTTAAAAPAAAAASASVAPAATAAPAAAAGPAAAVATLAAAAPIAAAASAPDVAAIAAAAPGAATAPAAGTAPVGAGAPPSITLAAAAPAPASAAEPPTAQPLPASAANDPTGAAHAATAKAAPAAAPASSSAKARPTPAPASPARAAAGSGPGKLAAASTDAANAPSKPAAAAASGPGKPAPSDDAKPAVARSRKSTAAEDARRAANDDARAAARGSAKPIASAEAKPTSNGAAKTGARDAKPAATSPTKAASGSARATASNGAKPASSGASKPRPPARSEALEKALAEAEGLASEHELQALEAYRELGSRHPKDSRVLEGWSRVAASTGWWGESLKVAERWAAIDRSAAAHIHLARTQRRLGQIEHAIATLQDLLERDPKNADARNLLAIYDWTKVALR